MPEHFGRGAGHDNPRVVQLLNIPLFDHIPRRQLALIAANLDEVTVDAGEVLVREGHHNDAFWIILDGEVEMDLAGVVHRTLGPGDFFGATSMLDGRPAVATVTSLSRLHGLVASAAQFRALEGHDTIVMRLMSAALERMREDLEILRHRASTG